MSRHTPGPWTIADIMDDYGRVAYIIKQQPHVLEHTIEEYKTITANRKIMEAAPDLLEALKYARRRLNYIDSDLAFVDAAIAKAVGL